MARRLVQGSGGGAGGQPRSPDGRWHLPGGRWWAGRLPRGEAKVRVEGGAPGWALIQPGQMYTCDSMGAAARRLAAATAQQRRRRQRISPQGAETGVKAAMGGWAEGWVAQEAGWARLRSPGAAAVAAAAAVPLPGPAALQGARSAAVRPSTPQEAAAVQRRVCAGEGTPRCSPRRPRAAAASALVMHRRGAWLLG